MNYDPQQVTPQSVAGGTVASGGSGYVVGDLVGPSDGALADGSLAASFYVKSVDGGGAITAVVMLEGGYYVVLPATPSTVTGGSGTGASLTLTFTTPTTLGWQVPAASDLQTVLSGIVTNTADESLVGGNRSALAISGAVAMVRGAIRKGRRTPLSLTAGSVPPEAFIHTLILAVNILVGAKPTLIQSVVGPNGGVYTPFNNMRDEAKKWLEDTANGRPTDPPTDPDTSFQSATYAGGNSEYNDLTTFGAPSTLAWNPATNSQYNQGTGGSGAVQVLFYSSDPNTESVTPANQASPALAYSLTAGLPLYKWNTSTHTWI